MLLASLPDSALGHLLFDDQAVQLCCWLCAVVVVAVVNGDFTSNSIINVNASCASSSSRSNSAVDAADVADDGAT